MRPQSLARLSRHAASRALALVAAVVLAACTTTQPTEPAGEHLSGRIAIRVPAHHSEPERGLNASFELHGSATAGSLRLSSALGTTLAQAQWTAQSAQLTTSDGITSFRDMDALTQQLLGEVLPIAALFDWLRGRPWGGAPSQPEPGANGFAQLGWQVDLSRHAQGWVLALRTDAPRVSVRARLDASDAPAQ